MNWVRGNKIGHGSFGAVNLAIPTNQNSKLMAVKSCGAANSASLMNEKIILDELKGCPEIISCFGDCFSFENGEKLYNVLLDYASGGSISDKIKNSDNHQLDEFEVRGYTKSILRGLEFIHKNGYVHCDIKTQNILLNHNDEVRIADFGLAKRGALEKQSILGCELRGTPMYMSPEMVTRGEQECPSDIWALGCVVVEMLTGATAWSCSNMAALLMIIGLGEEVPKIPSNLSDEAKDFLGKCFTKDPRKRWTAEMLLNHSFMCNLDDDEHVTYSMCDEFSSVTLEEAKENFSVSPRCPFDFPEWVSESNSLTPSALSELGLGFGTSAAERLKELVCLQTPDWSVEDDWLAVR